MKRNLVWVIASALSVASFGSASAADLAPQPYTKAPPPPAPVFSWTGFYIGANGGGGSARNCWDLLEDATGAVFDPALHEGCHQATGGTAGGQIGYRWQAPSNWVIGVEGQGNWADFRGGNDSLVFDDVHNRSRLDAWGTITGQLGYAWNNVLLYGKAGGAVTDNKFDAFSISTGDLLSSANDTRWGGVLGIGVEVGFAQGWSLGFEYDHLFMGNRLAAFNTPGPAPAFDGSDRISQDVDIGLVRLNYRFGGAGPGYGGYGGY